MERAELIAKAPGRLEAPPGRALKERSIRGIFLGCALLSIATTAAIIVIFFSQTISFFREVSIAEYLTGTRWATLAQPPSYGVLPLITGTLLVMAIAMAVALPLGLLAAVYLSEFAHERVRRVVKPILEVLAGIPTVVYGYFALMFVTPLLRTIFPEIGFWNALSAGVVMGFMILPMVSSLSEDALYAVPRSLREGAYALGATKYEVVAKVVMPAAFSGIVASFILAMSRAIGETMIVAMAAGRTPTFPPHPLGPVETMTAYMLNIATGDHEAGAFIWSTLFAVGSTLFVMTLILNIVSHFLVRRFRERYE